MHRLFAPFLAMVVLLAVLAPVPGQAADADNKGIKLEFDAAVLQRMSAFVSAFSEVDPQGRWHQIDDAAQADPKWLVSFGVLHNWMHNASAFAVDNGVASIDAAVVATTIEEYTGLKFDSHVAVPETGISFADGKYAIATDTPQEGPQAVVANVYVTPGNELIMCGYVADKGAPEGAQTGHDDLRVRVAHHTWQGKNCWKLLSWAWAGKPEAKPAGQVTEQPVEQPVAQPAEHQAEEPDTEQPAEQPKVESVPAEPQPEAAPTQPETPIPTHRDEPTQTETPVPAPEAPIVPVESEPVAGQGAPVAAPALAANATSVTDAAPLAIAVCDAEPVAGAMPQALADNTQAAPEQEAIAQPEPTSAPEVASAPAAPSENEEAAPAAQGTRIPFTASAEPDFSSILSLIVPEGWHHRNVGGVVEMTPATSDADDAWVVVEAVRLGSRKPQDAVKLFAGGAELAPYGVHGNSFLFATDVAPLGHRDHLLVVDADANLICRLTWQADDRYRAAVDTVLRGLQVKGTPVAQ